MIVGLAVAIGGSFLAVSKFEPKYEAKLFFRIIQNLEWIELAKGLGDKQDPKNVLSMIESDIIASRVIADPEIANSKELRSESNPVAALKKMVNVKSEGGRELYAINARSHVPTVAANIAHSYWQKFNREQEHFKVRQSKLLLEALEGEISSYTSQLKTLEADLQETYAKMTDTEGGVIRGPAGNIISARLSELEDAKRDNLAKIAIAKRDIQRHKTDPYETSIDQNDLLIDTEALNEVRTAQSRVNDLREQLDQISWQKGPSHPDFEKTNGLLNAAIQELARVKKNGMKKLSLVQRREGEERNKTALKELTRILEELEHKQTLIEADLADEQKNIRAFKNLRFEYDRKLETQQNDLQTLTKLRVRAREIRLKQIAPFSVTRVFINSEDESVPVPSEPVEKYPSKQIAGISAAGLVVPFAIFLLFEFREKRVVFPEQMHDQAKLIGEIADLPDRFDFKSRKKQQAQVFEESVNGVGTILRNQTSGEKVKSLVVTSAVSNEGKTTFASQLALSLARTSNQRILLIDCDLRNPSVHRVFKMEVEPGVVDVLEEEIELFDCIQPGNHANLDVLTAGLLTDSPHSLLGSDDFAKILGKVETEYAYVIIDTPPVLAASESLVVGHLADAAIMCVMKDVSRLDVVRRAYDRLVGARINVFGYVFGGVPQSEYAQRYGGYNYVHPRVKASS